MGSVDISQALKQDRMEMLGDRSKQKSLPVKTASCSSPKFASHQSAPFCDVGSREQTKQEDGLGPFSSAVSDRMTQRQGKGVRRSF